MEKVTVTVTREGPFCFRAEIEGHHEAGLHRGKRKAIAIGKLTEHNPHLFNIHKGGEKDSGLKIVKREIKKTSYALVEERPDIKYERGESFEEALGQLVEHNCGEFNVEEIKYFGKQ